MHVCPSVAQPFKGELLSILGIVQMISVVVMLGHCAPVPPFPSRARA